MSESPVSAHDRRLFVGCFLALVTTAFGFILRVMIIDDWKAEFALTDVQKGELFGVGLWPFAISIVLFSLVIDRIGYGRAMVFAFVCHVLSAVLTIFANGYWSLYWATFVCAIGNGTVEAVINPVVATMFAREKTRWLNVLHAGWPGGLVLGGLLAIFLGDIDWRTKVALLLLPAIAYGVILMRCRFPISERVAAGVSDREMLREAGGLGMFVVLVLVCLELGRVFDVTPWIAVVAAAAISIGYGIAVRGFGRPLFVFLLLLMIPLATTELGTDSWISSLVEVEMIALGGHPGWVLVYTAAIMMVLRLCSGSIVHRLSPLGLLAVSTAIAMVGLYWLSAATGATVFLAATVYGLGKTFFWPTMLGVVAETFPRGGALTLNATGGVGMIGAGLVGTVVLGWFQDVSTTRLLQERAPAVAAAVQVEKKFVFGDYVAVDVEKRKLLAPEDAAIVATAEQDSRRDALVKVLVFPSIMLVSYLGLMLWFRSRGGYRPQSVATD